MSGKALASLNELKSCGDGGSVTFKGRVLRLWEPGGLRMCLIGDESALMRVELGQAMVREGRSYEFRDAIARSYPGGWHSAELSHDSQVIPLDLDVPVSQDESYIERTFKILSGVQRKKGRAAGRIAAWRHPAERGGDD
ncbi:MAG TPA: hypothetical protein VGR43_11330 [Dehalococcoidia bacterium]|jgi:hypothetical protein|nr:hypothetical protein [Dehalococcoidia bacterium]